MLGVVRVELCVVITNDQLIQSVRTLFFFLCWLTVRNISLYSIQYRQIDDDGRASVRFDLI
jgi:hypothetical protein